MSENLIPASYFPQYTKIPNEYANLFINYSDNKFESTIIKLSNDLLNYSNIKLAGRLIIFKITKMSGFYIEDYLNNYKNTLSIDILEFMFKHKKELQNIVEKYDYLNYYKRDVFNSSVLKNYLLKSFYDQEPLETPVMFYLRYAIFLYNDYSKDDKKTIEKITKIFLDLATQFYTAPTPAAKTAGTPKAQCGSCFASPYDDDLPGIFESFKESALISKYQGGIGSGFTKIRHSSINSNGMASGVKHIARLLNDTIEYVDQSGSRKGAATAHLHDWHIDFEDFIGFTSNNQPAENRLKSLNTCVWLSDLFVRRCKKNEGWTTFCPSRVNLYGKYSLEFEEEYLKAESQAILDEKILKELEDEFEILKIKKFKESVNSDINKKINTVVKKLYDHKKNMIVSKRYTNTQELLNNICSVEINCGMPYIMYGDNINVKSNQMNIGKINVSNLCVEITQVSDSTKIFSCNLSSISLKSFVKKNYFGNSGYINLTNMFSERDSFIFFLAKNNLFNFNKLSEITKNIVENLNISIDKNYYPVDGKIKDFNLQTRPLGIGVSGFDDCIKHLDLLFESKEADWLNQAIFSCMYYSSLEKSNEMALEKGSYYYFDKNTFSINTSSEYILNREEFPYIEKNIINDKVVEYIFEGSPFKNGILQFDLWKFNSYLKESLNTLDNKVYKKEDDEPIEPFVWDTTSSEIFEGTWRGSTDINFTNDDRIPSWKSLKQKIKTNGIYNSMLLTCMPTASTAALLRNAETTEAHTANIYARKTSSGIFIVCNYSFMKDFKRIGLYTSNLLEFLKFKKGSIQGYDKYIENYVNISDKEKNNYLNNKERVKFLIKKHKTMYEISQKDILKKARQRAIYIDQSQSTNIYLKSPSLNVLKAVHYYSNKLGLKTGMYYLRQTGGSESSDSKGGFTVSPDLIKYFNEEKKEVIENNTSSLKKKSSYFSNNTSSSENNHSSYKEKDPYEIEECDMCGA